jgi:uncharacterized membrane protein
LAAEDTKLQAPPRIKIRIESLSDLVFGLALSIGSLILIENPTTSGTGLATNVVLFGFSFVIVVLIWLGYSRTTAVLAMEVPYALLANVALLFLVALEPYLFYVLVSSPAQNPGFADAASVVYGLDLGGMFLMLAALGRLVLRRANIRAAGSTALHPLVLERFRRVGRADAVAGAVFVVSTLPIFWIETPAGYLRFDLWGIAFVVFIPTFGRRWSEYRKRGRDHERSDKQDAT